jgi:hypothetical protein
MAQELKGAVTGALASANGGSRTGGGEVGAEVKKVFAK